LLSYKPLDLEEGRKEGRRDEEGKREGRGEGSFHLYVL
jgi:hypothetical protein